MNKDKNKSITCLRCRQTKNYKHFESSLDASLHQVCQKCRDFMSARLDFSVQMDKRFHSMRGVDYETTLLYLKAYGNTALWSQVSID